MIIRHHGKAEACQAPLHVNARSSSLNIVRHGNSRNKKSALNTLILGVDDILDMGQYWILINVDRREQFGNHGSVKMGGTRAVFTGLIPYLTLHTSRTALSPAAEDGHLETWISR